MTISQARKILGQEALQSSDEELMRDIEAATLLKDLFFNHMMESRNNLATTHQKCHNMAVYGDDQASNHLHSSI